MYKSRQIVIISNEVFHKFTVAYTRYNNTQNNDSQHNEKYNMKHSIMTISIMVELCHLS